MSHVSRSGDIVKIAEDFRRGDHAAVAELHRLYGHRLRAFLQSFVVATDLAEDLTQDVMVRAYIKRSTLKDPAKIEAWLFAMARNLALREMQRKRHRSERSAEPEEIARRAGSDPTQSPGRKTQEEQAAVILRDALASLDDKKRTLMALRYYSELSHKEIAEMMEMPIGSVGTTIKRSLESMRKHLESKGLGPEDLIP